VRINASILGVANVVWVAGDRLQGGKYTIERELGGGRFGITYLVRNRNSDRLVLKASKSFAFLSKSKLPRKCVSKASYN